MGIWQWIKDHLQKPPVEDREPVLSSEQVGKLIKDHLEKVNPKLARLFRLKAHLYSHEDICNNLNITPEELRRLQVELHTQLGSIWKEHNVDRRLRSQLDRVASG
jgi:hypothetical protein